MIEKLQGFFYLYNKYISKLYYIIIILLTYNFMSDARLFDAEFFENYYCGMIPVKTQSLAWKFLHVFIVKNFNIIIYVLFCIKSWFSILLPTFT